MRSFSKKLAFVLAAAMVVTGFAPAAQAKAADEMAINKSSQILYVNEGINHKGAEGVPAGKGNVSVYDFSVKNKPSNWKTAYSFAWSSSNEDVVTVKAGGVATAVGVGKATVYCKVTEKATKKVTTLKTAVEVKENAAKVAIKNADKYDGTTVEVNGFVDLDRIMYNAAGKSTTKRGTLVTDYTRWVAEPSKGVEINQSNGKFTFTEEAEAGDYTLYCETYQSSKYTKTTATSDKVVVTFVGADAFEVDQTASNGFNLLFNKAADVKIADVTVNKIIKVGDSTGEIPMVVSGVTMSTDKKTASVSLFSNFENGVNYEISVKGYEEAVTFVASYGVPVSMTIKAVDTVYVNGDPVKLTFNLFDAEGNDVTNTVEGNITFSAQDVATTDYFVDNGYIIINKDGVVATVNAEFSFYKNDTDLDMTVIKGTGLVAGITKSADSLASISIAPIFWSSNLKQIPVNLYDTDNGTYATLEVKIKTTNSNDDGSYKYSNGDFLMYPIGGTTPQIRLRSSNPEVFDIDGNIIVPFKEGTSAVLLEFVVDGNVNTVAAQYITVSPAAKVSRVIVNGSIVAGTVDGFATEKVGLGVQDQYGFTWGLDAVTGYENRRDDKGELIKDDNGNLKWFPVYRTNENGKTTFESIKFENGPAIKNSVYFEERGKDNGWTDQVVVDGYALFNDMVSEGYISSDWKVNGKDVNAITKRIVIKNDVKNGMGDGLEFTIVVTLKKDTGNPVVSVVADGTTSGNVAVFNTDNSYDNAESMKQVTFKVMTKANGITTGQKDIAGVKPANGVVASGSAIGELYYTLTRNNKDITDTFAVEQGKNYVTLKYSNCADLYTAEAYNVIEDKNFIRDYSGKKDIGAGAYTFTVYEVAKNKTSGKLYFAYVGAASTSVTWDAGNYTFVKRLAESVTAGYTDEDLRNCFEITNLKNEKTDITTYKVDKTDSVNYVHVNSITFFEPIKGTGYYVPYTVKINAALKKVN